MSPNVSVRIDVGQLLADREAERAEAKAQAIENETSARVKPERKRKSDTIDGEPQAKKVKAKAMKKAPEASSSKTIIPKITLKLGPIKPKELDTFPCCLCVSQSAEGLLSVHDPPIGRKEGESGLPGERAVWMAHEQCANVVPETWVDDIETGTFNEDGTRQKEKVIFGVGGIVKDRWNLVRTPYG